MSKFELINGSRELLYLVQPLWENLNKQHEIGSNYFSDKFRNFKPMASFGITMATYVAQNYGANKIQRIRSGIKQCVMMSVGFSIVIGVVNIL